MISLSPWLILILAIPVLLLGEFLVRRIGILARFNIPVPVVGGLVISLLVLTINISGMGTIELQTSVATRWWTWLVTTAEEWSLGASVSVNRPFLVAFFTCIGLNASWQIARRGSWQTVAFLTVSTLLALVQNVVGISLAEFLGVSPLLGLVCGAVSMTGGHGTSAGFSDVIAQAGLPEAGVFGAAAATFGLVCGGLLGGPLGGALIRSKKLDPSDTTDTDKINGAISIKADFIRDLRTMFGFGRTFLCHLLIVLFCLKAGSWFSALVRDAGLTFPVYIGSMVLGVLIRNVLDLSGKHWIRTEVVNSMGAVFLGIFLAVALMSVQLQQLAIAALPMLIILGVQVGVMALFAYYVTFRVMGRDYDGAIMAGGHSGFGLGATPNAVANMEALTERFSPAPRAFLVVPITGGFLLDFTNALAITISLNWIGG